MRITILTLLVAFLGISGVVAGAGNPNEPNTSFEWQQKGLTVSFEDTTPLQLYIVSWYWDFGDGEHSNIQNPTHTYPGYGNYTVFFTTWNSQGFSRTVSQTVWVKEGVGVEPQFSMMFWISLLMLFGGAFVILFGKFSNVRIGGSLLVLIGIIMLVMNPPQVGLAEAFHTDNPFISYGVPLILLILLVAGLATSKNPLVRIGLVLMFLTSVVVLMAM